MSKHERPGCIVAICFLALSLGFAYAVGEFSSYVTSTGMLRAAEAIEEAHNAS